MFADQKILLNLTFIFIRVLYRDQGIFFTEAQTRDTQNVSRRVQNNSESPERQLQVTFRTFKIVPQKYFKQIHPTQESPMEYPELNIPDLRD